MQMKVQVEGFDIIASGKAILIVISSFIANSAVSQKPGFYALSPEKRCIPCLICHNTTGIKQVT